jgi:hypothetical protein
MRTLIIVIAVVVVLVLVGWVSFSHGPNRSSINVETNKIEKDAQSMVESGSQMLDNAKQSVERPQATTRSSGAPSSDAPSNAD